MGTAQAPVALVFNPGSASLKFELIEVTPGRENASQCRKLASASIEGMGKECKILVFEGRRIARHKRCDVRGMSAGAAFALQWLREQSAPEWPALEKLGFAGVRVVHGGRYYTGATRFSPEVKAHIEELRELAPLHNQSSLDILAVLERDLPDVPAMVAFDTAFHCTLPEVAWRYPIERGRADRLGIRKFGFHGLSHRYMLEQYAHTVGKRPEAVSVITLHLESGSSAAAIRRGKSVDTTMGLTPLEGLMMGTRSGSIDPAIVTFLMRRLGTGPDEVMTLLEKKSGLLGIAGETFDTRELVKRDDAAARLALEMFSYRVRLAVGAYLAAVPDTQAVIFGGGIGEDTPTIRAQVCEGLRGWGMELDEDINARSTSGAACITRPDSRLQAFVVPVEEGLQIAHECAAAAALG